MDQIPGNTAEQEVWIQSGREPALVDRRQKEQLYAGHGRAQKSQSDNQVNDQIHSGASGELGSAAA